MFAVMRVKLEKVDFEELEKTALAAQGKDEVLVHTDKVHGTSVHARRVGSMKR